MEKLIDLHAHTTASDGSMRPAELVRQAKEAGLCAIAVTDHDTVSGVEEAQEEGRRIGVEVIAGVEIGVEFLPEMHMLGYFFNDSYKNIGAVLSELINNREMRNPKIIAKLNELGFDISNDEVVSASEGDVIGRPHIAKVMVDKGYVKTINEAFDKYLASGRPAYFKKDRLSPYQGIQEILKAGGIPVLAHPMHLDLGLAQLDELLFRMASVGLKGVEVYYVDHPYNFKEQVKYLAKKHKLIATGGSDFHGSFKPEIKLGKGYGKLKIPYSILEELKGEIPNT